MKTGKTHYRLRAILGLGGLSAALAAGCHWHDSARSPAPESRPAEAAAEPAAGSTSAPSLVLWDKSAKGIKLKYPADWQPKKNPDYELMLLPAGASKDDRRITVDIPDLPPHLPFMIQMGRVEHDYVQDLKKDHPDLQVQDSVVVKMPESTAKLVRSQWRQNGTVYHDVALLIIHASAVFIVDAQAGEADLSSTRSAFDSMTGSIIWTKH
jgi:hypothetical protein